MDSALYILMRTDMDSMTPGRAMAQASHASNAFVNHAGTLPLSEEGNLPARWRTETPQGFGTAIVLGVTDEEMRNSVELARATGLITGIVNDPTYPILDGDTVHYISVDTCAYVFGLRKDPLLKSIVGKFNLHP